MDGDKDATMRGLHHVTAISGKPSQNLDFYSRTLGLRFVKRTVNFDDPGTYHFYYGDEAGSPGTILTFFPWEHAAVGRAGLGLAQTTAFRVPARSIGYWTHRLIEKGVKHEALTKHFGEPVLSFSDADDMSLALVGTAGAEGEAAWSNSEIAAEHAIRGFHGVTLMLDAAAPTGAILTDVLGFTEAGREGARMSATGPTMVSAASWISARQEASWPAAWGAAPCIMSPFELQMTRSRPRWRASS